MTQYLDQKGKFGLENTLPLISRTSITSGTRPLFGSFRAGDWAAIAFTADTSILSERSFERESTAPRPMPGKAVELLHSAVLCQWVRSYLVSYILDACIIQGQLFIVDNRL